MRCENTGDRARDRNRGRPRVYFGLRAHEEKVFESIQVY